MRERLTVSPRTYALVAQAAMAILVLIVFSGAAVRTSGSGLGCPDWPDCRGTFLPAFEKHTWMEYSNRLLSSVVGVVCVAAGVLAFRLRPLRRDILRPAVVLPVGVIAEGALGAAAVAFDLQCPHLIAHYLLSAALLVAGAVLVWRLRRGAGAARPENPGAIVVAGTFATAAGPHAGGAGTGDYVARLDAFGAETLRTIIHIHGHSGTVVGVSSVLLWLFARSKGVTGGLMRALTAVCVLMAVQGAIGLIQYHNELPSELVWIHASLAAVVWLAFVFAVLAAGRPAPRAA